MTHEQHYLNKLMHDIRELFKSDMVLMHYAEYYYPKGLATLDDVLMNAVKVSAAYRENGLGIDGKERKGKKLEALREEFVATVTA